MRPLTKLLFCNAMPEVLVPAVADLTVSLISILIPLARDPLAEREAGLPLQTALFRPAAGCNGCFYLMLFTRQTDSTSQVI